MVKLHAAVLTSRVTVYSNYLGHYVRPVLVCLPGRTPSQAKVCLRLHLHVLFVVSKFMDQI